MSSQNNLPVVDLQQEFDRWNKSYGISAPTVAMPDLSVPFDPPPFNFNNEFYISTKNQPWVKTAQKRQGLTNVIGSAATEFARLNLKTRTAAAYGAANFFNGLDLVSQFIARTVNETKSLIEPMVKNTQWASLAMPLWRGGGFEEIADWAEKEGERLATYANLTRNTNDKLAFLEDMFTEAAGSAVPGIAQFMLDIGSGLSFAYARGSQEAFNKEKNPIVNGLVEAAKVETLDLLFRLMRPFRYYLRAPVLGAVMGAEGAIEAPEGQKAEAFAKGFGTMAIYAATSTGGRYGLNDVNRYIYNKYFNDVAPVLRKLGDSILDSWNHVDYEGNKVSLRQALAEDGFLVIPSKAERRDINEKLWQRFSNRYLSIENLTERAIKLGMPKPKPGEDPKLLTRAYLGNAGQVKSILEDKTFGIDKNGKIFITGEGLRPIIDDYQKNNKFSQPKFIRKGFSNAEEMINDLNNYLKALRILEDLRRPKSERDPELIANPEWIDTSREILSELRNKYSDNYLNFENIGKRISAYSRRVLRWMVDSGTMSIDQYEKIVLANPNYVPFEYIFENVPEVGIASSGNKPFTETSSGIKRIKGTDVTFEQIASPLESLMKYTYRIVDRASRNRIARSIAKMAEIPELGIKNEPVPIRPIMVKAEEINIFKQEITRQASSIKENVRKTVESGGGIATGQSAPMQKLEKIISDALVNRGFTEGEASSALERVKQAAQKNKIETKPGETIVETIEKTIDRLVQTTTEIFERPQDTTIFRPMDKLSLSEWAERNKKIIYYEDGKPRILDVPENLYESMSGMNELSAHVALKIARSMSTLLRRGVTMSPDFWVRNFIRDNMNAWIMSTTGFRPFVDPAMIFADIIGRKDLYYDWLRSGAAHSTFVELSRPQLNHMLDSLSRNESAWKYMNIFEDAEKASLAVEESTRIGLFKSAKRRGLSDLEAGLIAREGTTDFGVRGSSRSMQEWSQATAFMNPAIQGVLRSGRAIKKNPINTTLSALISVSLPSFLVWLAYKDDPKYKELQRYKSDIGWPIIAGDTVGIVPKPFTYGQIFGTALERFLDYAYEKDPHAFDGIGRSLLESVTPVQGDPRGLFVPTAFKPILENWLDWSIFREMPIIPEAKKEVMDEFQYTKYTSEMAKMIGKLLGYSPAKIDNYVRGYAGGTGMYGLELLDMALSLLQDPEKTKGKRPTELADYPILKAFIARPTESIPRALTEFYDESEKITKQYNTYMDQMAEMNPDIATQILMENPKVEGLMPTIRAAKNEISEINKAIQIAVWTKPKDEKGEEAKRALIKNLETTRMYVARIHVKLFNDLMKDMDPEELEKYKNTLQKEAKEDPTDEIIQGILKGLENE